MHGFPLGLLAELAACMGADGFTFLGSAAGDRARGSTLHGGSTLCASPALRALRLPGGAPCHTPLRRSAAPHPAPSPNTVARSRPQPGSAHAPSVWQPFSAPGNADGPDSGEW